MPSDRTFFGCDIARYGSDFSVVIARKGNHVFHIESWNGNNLMETTGKIVALARKFNPEEINVDDAGVGGGVVDRLQELGLPVMGVNVGEAAQDAEQFVNLRAELFFSLAVRFRDGEIEIPPDETLMSQLSTLQYEVDSRGRIKLESKDDMQKRGIKSPDRADALMLAFANRTPGLLEYMRQLVENQAQPSTDAGRQVVNVQERRTEVILPEGPKPDAKKPVELPNLMDLYNSALTGGKPAIVCKGCGLAMGKHEPQVTDGIDHWHPACAVKKY